MSSCRDPHRGESFLLNGHVGRRQIFAHGNTLKYEDALVGIGGLKRHETRKAQIAILELPRRLPLGQQQNELEEGIAQFFIDKLQPQPLQGDHPAQVDLDPPLADRVVGVRFPIGRRVAVENIGHQLRVGPRPADAGLYHVIEERVVLGIEQNLALVIAADGAVDGRDSRTFAKYFHRAFEAGVGQQVVCGPEGSGRNAPQAVDMGQVRRHLPILPVSAPLNHDLRTDDAMTLLSDRF